MKKASKLRWLALFLVCFICNWEPHRTHSRHRVRNSTAVHAPHKHRKR